MSDYDKIEPLVRDADTEAAIDDLFEKINEIIELVNDIWRHDG